MQQEYIPGKYWDAVAVELSRRQGNNLLAGDNDPFYIYKRKKFLRLLSSITFKEKKILEIGCGPGGNLLEIYKQQPLQLTGCDISNEMLKVCKQNIADSSIELVKTDGNLPFHQEYFDIVITSSVLQHLTDDRMLEALVMDIGLVAKDDVYIFERIEKKHKSGSSNTGRTIKEYQELFEKNNMRLSGVRFLNVYRSKMFCGVVRKLFNRSNRKEGSPQSRISIFIQKIILVVTKPLDNLFPVKRDTAMLHFSKNTIG